MTHAGGVDAWSAGLTWAEAARVMTLRGGVNTTTVIVGTSLLGVAAGVVGVFALLRKRALVADALGHATLPGIALAFLGAVALGMDGRSLPLLLTGAVATGVLGVVCIQLLVRHTRLHEDAAIGIVLSVFFGAGVVLLSIVQRDPSGNAAGLGRFIYGQAAAMNRGDALLMAWVAVVAVVAAAALFKEFTLVCFDDAFARVGGWPVGVIDLGIMGLVVVVTAVGLQAVGLLLVVAMLIIPPVSARFWTDRMVLMVVLAGVLGGLGAYGGAVISSLFPGQPAGAVIVLVSGAVFAVSLLLAPRRGVLGVVARRAGARVRIAGDHLLEAMYEQASGNGGAVGAELVDEVAARRGWPGWFRVLMLRSLAARGRVARDRDGYRLTTRGLADGARVSRNHKLWEQYLISHADIAPSHVDWSVDQVEHVLTPEQISRLEATLAGRGVELPPRGRG